MCRITRPAAVDQLLEQLRPVAPRGTGTDGPAANIVTPGLPASGYAACLFAKGDGGAMVVDDAPARIPTGELSQGLAASLSAMPAAGTPYHEEDLLAVLKKHTYGGLCLCERCVASDEGNDA